MRIALIILFIWLSSSVLAQEMANGVTVDLKEPVFHDGVISTCQGGVITGPNLRVQAVHMKYTHLNADGEEDSEIEAEGKLIVELGEYIFVGDRLIYNLKKNEGVIFQGRAGSEPWFFGGDEIQLKSDGSYYIRNAFITTSENVYPEWKIVLGSATISSEMQLNASKVGLKILDTPIITLRTLNTNLKSIYDNPIKYRFRWGGVQGPRVGLTYELPFWERWKAFFRLDFRLTRGPGGGIDTYYRSVDHRTVFQSMNYISCDNALSNVHENFRYRLEGKYEKLMLDDKVNVLLTYDKVSDIDLPSEYHDNDFEIETTGRTQLLVRRQEMDWIAKLYSRVRINNFQTVKQELPTFSTYFKPFLLGNTGIVSENQAEVSYLSFQYANNLPHVQNYDSTRFEYRPYFYRSFTLGNWVLTPELGGNAIFYGNSPEQKSQYLLQGQGGCKLNSTLHRFYGPFKHVIEPYTYYRYYTFPTSSPHQHYIFDINDGWYRLNQWTWGIKNSIYAKSCEQKISQLFTADLFAHAFLDTPTFKQTIPKVYGRVSFAWLSNVNSYISTAWDLEEHRLDHFNFRSEWTFSADFAMAAEFRHRDSFCWRKADPTNFILDSYRSVDRLRHSSLSDRRDTFLVHFYYRFHPKWSSEWISRYGWNRRHQPNYLEYELNLFTTIRTGWNWKLSYQHLEGDNRVAVYLNLGLDRPECKCQN